jgi:hypothetical protein
VAAVLDHRQLRARDAVGGADRILEGPQAVVAGRAQQDQPAGLVGVPQRELDRGGPQAEKPTAAVRRIPSRSSRTA